MCAGQETKQDAAPKPQRKPKAKPKLSLPKKKAGGAATEPADSEPKVKAKAKPKDLCSPLSAFGRDSAAGDTR